MQCTNCFTHYSSSYCQLCGTKPIKKAKPIRKVGAKMEGLNKEYGKLRIQYLKVYPICEVVGCCNPSNEIHHMKARDNRRLIDDNHFLAVCRPCHQKIELNPLWAKENGYSKSRLN